MGGLTGLLIESFGIGMPMDLHMLVNSVWSEGDYPCA